MKKFMFFLSSLLLLMTSCSNEYLDESGALDAGKLQSEKVRWYGTKLIDGVQTRGVADGTKRWNQDAGIYIKFLNEPSDPAYLEKVKLIASEWEEYAGIQFHYVAGHMNTDVRISFDWNGNDWLTWSYTGTDAKFEQDQSVPTAVLAGLEYLDEDEFKGDVLRLFGQILGLEYEQRHQEWSQNGYWKTETALKRYWESQFDGYDMDWSEIQRYVFDPLTQQNTLQLFQTEEIDELSVMAWPYYSRQQTTQLLANYELSEGDKEFIALLYPKTESSLPTIQEAWVDAGYFVWNDASKTSLSITDLGREQEYLPDVSDGEQLTSGREMFFATAKLKTVPKFNSSNIVDFSGMFSYCLVLTTVPLLDTSNGTNFSNMFAYCYSLAAIPLLDTSNGTDFSMMFWDCSLTTVPLFDTSNGTDFSDMLSFCRKLTAIPLFDTSNGTNFARMFYGCNSLASIPLLNTSNGTTFEGMLSGCGLLTTVPLFDTSNGTSFSYMLGHCSSLTAVPLFNTSKGTCFSLMFHECTSLTATPLLDTSNGTDFRYMFCDCTSLTTIPEISTLNGTDFASMFRRCTSLITIPLLDTSNGTDFSDMFYGCTSLVEVPQINTSEGIYFRAMFFDCSNLASKPQLDLSNAVELYSMYEGTPFENDPL